MAVDKLICPFCNIESKRIIIQNEYCYAVLDKYPVSSGHSLIIPYSHTPDYFTLTSKEKYSIIDLLDEMKNYLFEKYNPEGFNIGININEFAGQTVEHAHIHLIPRYKNDVDNPAGGVRNVIPGKGKYLNN